MTAVLITARAGHRLYSTDTPTGPTLDCSCGVFTLNDGPQYRNVHATSKTGSSVQESPALDHAVVLDRWRHHCHAFDAAMTVRVA